MSWTPCGKSVTACIHVMYWMSQHVLLGKWHQRKHTINFWHPLHWSPPTILQNAHFKQIRWAIPSCWHPMVIGTLSTSFNAKPSSSIISHSSFIINQLPWAIKVPCPFLLGAASLLPLSLVNCACATVIKRRKATTWPRTWLTRVRWSHPS